MGQLAPWAAQNPDAVRQWEQQMGLPVDGTYDPELQQRIESYQLLLGQTPGQTSDTDSAAEWNALNQQIQARASTLNPSDPAPMRDTAFQAFLRESGAQESQLLDEIRYRTTQNTEEINRRAAGFEAQRSETVQNNQATQEQGTQRIKEGFQGRGVLGSSMQEQDTTELAQNIGRQQSQQLGAIDEQAMTFNNERRGALADFARSARGDLAGLYRRRVDEELNARDRVRLQDAEGKYPRG